MTSNFSIYLAERKCGGGENQRTWYHANLMLINEYTGDVVQQIDFNNTLQSLKMQPKVCEGISKAYSLKMPEMSLMLQGSEYEVKSKWLHMLKYGLYIHDRDDVNYDEDFHHNPRLETLNCRAGVIAALRVIGIIPDLSVFKNPQGTRCTRMPIGRAFSVSAAPPLDLETIRVQINKLGQILGRNVPVPSTEEFNIGQGWD